MSAPLTGQHDDFVGDDEEITDSARDADLATLTALPIAIAAITLDPGSPLPIHEQICQAIRTAIWAGELPAGTLLPTSREFALHLHVARNTVGLAYARLVAEGHLVSNRRRGTRVASEFPARVTFEQESRVAPPAPNVIPIGFHASHALAIQVARSPDGAPFALHASDPILYPRTKLGRRLADRFLGAPRAEQFNIAPPGEPSHFQKSVADYVRQSRGVVCEPQQIIPVSGLESALDLTIRILIDPGHTVQIEDPSMDVVFSAFLSAGARIEPIPSDAHGPNPARAAGPPPRLMFVSPSVGFPFGGQMPEARRQQVLEAARANNAIVFENDSYCELRYSGARVRAIQGQDTESRVIYYGSFFETLSSAIGGGFLVVPLPLVDAFVEVSRRLRHQPAPQIQEGLAGFIDEHEFAMHARSVRAVFAKRLELLKQACAACLPGFGISEPLGGLHLVVSLDERYDESAVCAQACAQGLPVAPLSLFYRRPGQNRGIVIGFGAVPERLIQPVVKQLASVLARSSESERARVSA